MGTPRTVTPRTVTPRTVTPRTVTPRTVTPRTVTPRVQTVPVEGLTSAETQAVVTIAALLAGATLAGLGIQAATSIPGLTAEASAIASVLFLSLPADVRSDFGEARTLRTLRPVAAAVASSRPMPGVVVPEGADEYGILANRRRQEHLMRALFAFNAAKRIFSPKRVDAGSEASAGRGIADRVARELGNFRAHLKESAKRVAADVNLAAQARAHGPVLGWRHGTPEAPRVEHQRADGKNFDVRKPIPARLGALPGVLFGCTCTAVAPFPGAKVLN